MATYNGSRFVREQLDSIAAQTLLPAELIVTDDRSSDDTLAIVRAFADTAPFPVHIHHNPVNLGFRGNFMHAVELCSCPVIALCDQDDVWESHKLACAIAPFAEPDVVLAYHEAWLIDEAGTRMGFARLHGAPARVPPSSLFPLNNPYGFSMLFRRELLALGDLWPRSVDNLDRHQRMAHDQWLFFLACALGTIAYIDEPLAGYRQHGSNTYGIEAPVRTRWDRLDRWINVRAPEFGSLAHAARVRAEILEAAAPRLNPSWRSHAEQAVARYRALSRHLAWRSDAYDAAGALTRARAWLALLGDGAYANRTRWTFGRKAALVDLGCALASRHLLTGVASRGTDNDRRPGKRTR
jgi:glycosyltransferase involved in cell wall biosynthesis